MGSNYYSSLNHWVIGSSQREILSLG